MKKIRSALISLSDKTNLKPLLQALKKNRVKIISSGGTFKIIKKLGFKCLEVSKFTNSDEILEGRVKTLHPLTTTSSPEHTTPTANTNTTNSGRTRHEPTQTQPSPAQSCVAMCFAEHASSA